MRILHDSFRAEYRSPFGTLPVGETCILHIDIPTSCRTQEVSVVLAADGGTEQSVPLTLERQSDGYDRYCGSIAPTVCGLYFYHFRIRTAGEQFRLLRYGIHDTNIEDGTLWQLSVVPHEATPVWSQGAVLYQIFPDRFSRDGTCDCTEKLQPYTVHAAGDEPPEWRPNERGEVLNNDFYGGNLRGITAKLDALCELGVELIYLNPIFKAFSSHRYDTCDYLKIDPMLGTEADFIALCTELHRRKMHLILDGVFSHTGSRSVYFDRENEFGGGAYHNPNSRYRAWYCFDENTQTYRSWWDFPTLPTLNKQNPDYRAFVRTVVEKWLSLGADGFRLDVADELPDDFIIELRAALKAAKPDALLIGEVWEDASNKISYSVRRRYFTAPELDGVMNYPWKDAILAYASGADDGTQLVRTVETLCEHYPHTVLISTMLPLSTHDSPRALTALVAPCDGTREEMASHRLTTEQRALGLRRLRFAAVLQFALPGMPSIYYGDEVGTEGCKDPFNRTFYPWNREDTALRAHFTALAQLRKRSPALRCGTTAIRLDGDTVTVERTCGGDTVRFCLRQATLSWQIINTHGEVFL